MRTKSQAMRTTRWVAGGAVVGALLILLWQILEKETPPDLTTLGLLIVVLLGVAALANTKSAIALVRHVTSVDLFGVKVDLEVERARRIGRFADEEDRVPTPRRPRHPGDPKKEVDEVLAELRGKLRFIRGSVLGDPKSVPEPLVVARLEYLKLLSADEARQSRELLDELPDQIVRWEELDRESFLDSAWRFAYRLATRIFDRYARQRFKNAGWFVGDFDQGYGHRADFLVTNGDDWARVAARVASPRTSIDVTAGRLARTDSPHPEARPLVVVPDHVKGLWSEIESGPIQFPGGVVMVVRLGDLLAQPALLSTGGAVISPEDRVSRVEEEEEEEEEEEADWEEVSWEEEEEEEEEPEEERPSEP